MDAVNNLDDNHTRSDVGYCCIAVYLHIRGHAQFASLESHSATTMGTLLLKI